VTSQNRRHLTLSLLAGTLTLPLGACSTTSARSILGGPTKRQILAREEEARLAKFHITHPERQEEFNALWKYIHEHTNATPISDGRIRIESTGRILFKNKSSEENFLIRAASETLLAKKSGFVITHLDYFRNGLPLPSLASNISLSGRRWIGNYEDLRKDRNEQNLLSSRGKTLNKAIDGVILLLNKDEFPNRDRFSANELYMNLINQ